MPTSPATRASADTSRLSGAGCGAGEGTRTLGLLIRIGPQRHRDGDDARTIREAHQRAPRAARACGVPIPSHVVDLGVLGAAAPSSALAAASGPVATAAAGAWSLSSGPRRRFGGPGRVGHLRIGASRPRAHRNSWCGPTWRTLAHKVGSTRSMSTAVTSESCDCWLGISGAVSGRHCAARSAVSLVGKIPIER
jgi:hypothetical protein